jgi:very-short-patch-repair endonuclease
MAGKIRHPSSSAAWRLVAEQHGVVARRQLLALGLSSAAIEHRIATGRLHRIGHGIYSVGRSELSLRGRWLAAVLGCGSRAVLSHASAGELWGIMVAASAWIEVSVPFASPRVRPGVRVHRRPSLRECDWKLHDGIPVTNPVLTLIDVAATSLDDASLERAVGEADRLDLVDADSLGVALEHYPGKPGVGRLRDLLARRTFRLTDSELERRFLALVHSAGLSMPLTRQEVNGFRVDFFWPESGLVVETDGLRYHRTPAQQARDRVRDQVHAAAGLTALRFTHAQVYYEADRVRSTLITVVRRLERTRAA